jgi:hypothetical protein
MSANSNNNTGLNTSTTSFVDVTKETPVSITTTPIDEAKALQKQRINTLWKEHCRARFQNALDQERANAATEAAAENAAAVAQIAKDAKAEIALRQYVELAATKAAEAAAHAEKGNFAGAIKAADIVYQQLVAIGRKAAEVTQAREQAKIAERNREADAAVLFYGEGLGVPIRVSSKAAPKAVPQAAAQAVPKALLTTRVGSGLLTMVAKPEWGHHSVPDCSNADTLKGFQQLLQVGSFAAQKHTGHVSQSRTEERQKAKNQKKGFSNATISIAGSKDFSTLASGSENCFTKEDFEEYARFVYDKIHNGAQHKCKHCENYGNIAKGANPKSYKHDSTECCRSQLNCARCLKVGHTESECSKFCYVCWYHFNVKTKTETGLKVARESACWGHSHRSTGEGENERMICPMETLCEFCNKKGHVSEGCAFKKDLTIQRAFSRAVVSLRAFLNKKADHGEIDRSDFCNYCLKDHRGSCITLMNKMQNSKHIFAQSLKAYAQSRVDKHDHDIAARLAGTSSTSSTSSRGFSSDGFSHKVKTFTKEEMSMHNGVQLRMAQIEYKSLNEMMCQVPDMSFNVDHEDYFNRLVKDKPKYVNFRNVPAPAVPAPAVKSAPAVDTRIALIKAKDEADRAQEIENSRISLETKRADIMAQLADADYEECAPDIMDVDMWVTTAPVVPAPVVPAPVVPAPAVPAPVVPAPVVPAPVIPVVPAPVVPVVPAPVVALTEAEFTRIAEVAAQVSAQVQALENQVFDVKFATPAKTEKILKEKAKLIKKLRLLGVSARPTFPAPATAISNAEKAKVMEHTIIELASRLDRDMFVL